MSRRRLFAFACLGASAVLLLSELPASAQCMQHSKGNGSSPGTGFGLGFGIPNMQQFSSTPKTQQHFSQSHQQMLVHLHLTQFQQQQQWLSRSQQQMVQQQLQQVVQQKLQQQFVQQQLVQQQFVQQNLQQQFVQQQLLQQQFLQQQQQNLVQQQVIQLGKALNALPPPMLQPLPALPGPSADQQLAEQQAQQLIALRAVGTQQLQQPQQAIPDSSSTSSSPR